jgi:hypothetical protein
MVLRRGAQATCVLVVFKGRAFFEYPIPIFFGAILVALGSVGTATELSDPKNRCGGAPHALSSPPPDGAADAAAPLLAAALSAALTGFTAIVCFGESLSDSRFFMVRRPAASTLEEKS